MLRQALEEWTQGLSDEDQACAVAALAVLGFDGSGAGGPSLEALIARARERDPPDSFVSEVRFEDQLSRGEVAPAAEFARAWKAGAGKRFSPVRICVRVAKDEPSFAALVAWLERVLRNHAAGIATLFFFPSWLERHAVRWRWPLRVGIPDGPEGDALAEACERSVGRRTLIRFQRSTVAEVHDILLVPPLLDLEGFLVRLAKYNRATVVLVGGSLSVESWPKLMAMLRGSAMTAVEGDLVGYFRRMLSMLKLNLPLDFALNSIPPRSTSLLADPVFVQTSNLGAQPDAEFASVPDPVKGKSIVPGGTRGSLGELAKPPPVMGPGPLSAAEVRLKVGQLKPVRWVQARVLAVSRQNIAAIERGSWGELPPARRFVWGKPRLVGVHIGVPRAGALRPDQPLPEDSLQFLGGEETLSVAVIAHGCTVVALPPERASWAVALELERIQRREESGERALNTLLLPRFHDSSVAWFALRPGGSRVEARIIVAHKNRVLQTLILNGPVRAFEAPPMPMADEIELTVEAMVHGDLQSLHERRSFDAALVVNDSADGKPQLAWLAGQRVELSNLDDTKAVFDAISDQLARLCDESQDFSQPGSEVLRTLLVNLANLGVALRRRIVEDTALGQAIGDEAAASRFQIVSATPEAILPLEVVYEGDAPADAAPFCPNMEAGLATGSCAACPRRFSSEVVCSVRFWGLSKVIERNAYVRPTKGDPEFAVVVEPAAGGRWFPEPDSAVFAYSDRATATSTARTALAEVVNKLEKLTRRPCAPLRDWTDWRTAVKERNPSILALVPHTERKGGVAAIEIATEQLLRATQITGTEVGTRTPRLAVLFGCSTADAKIPFTSFPANLRHAGVEITIGTLSPVLGRHAAPALCDLLDHLAAAWREAPATPLAELMARFRRKQMSAGLPFGMAVIAYGDADWTFGR